MQREIYQLSYLYKTKVPLEFLTSSLKGTGHTKSSAFSVAVSVLLGFLLSQTSSFATIEFLEFCCVQSSGLHIAPTFLVYHCLSLQWIAKPLPKDR